MPCLSGFVQYSRWVPLRSCSRPTHSSKPYGRFRASATQATTTWKCLISIFTEEVHKRRRNFLSISELGYGSQEFNFRSVHLHLTKLVTWSNRNEDWKNANSVFQSPSSDLKVPIIRHGTWGMNYLWMTKEQSSFLPNKYVSQALYKTIQTHKKNEHWKTVRVTEKVSKTTIAIRFNLPV